MKMPKLTFNVRILALCMFLIVLGMVGFMVGDSGREKVTGMDTVTSTNSQNIEYVIDPGHLWQSSATGTASATIDEVTTNLKLAREIQQKVPNSMLSSDLYLQKLLDSDALNQIDTSSYPGLTEAYIDSIKNNVDNPYVTTEQNHPLKDNSFEVNKRVELFEELRIPGDRVISIHHDSPNGRSHVISKTESDLTKGIAGIINPATNEVDTRRNLKLVEYGATLVEVSPIDAQNREEISNNLVQGITNVLPEIEPVTVSVSKTTGTACFLPTTPITLADGTKKQIQDIRKGDKVLSYDLENKKPIASEVSNTFSHLEHDYLIINGKIKVTPYHYVYAKRKK